MTGSIFIRMLTGTTLLSVAAAVAHAAADPAYKADIESWRAKVEKSLRSDNGWLTLAGRHELSPGTNNVGSGRDNQIVLAPGLAPERLGAIDARRGQRQGHAQARVRRGDVQRPQRPDRLFRADAGTEWTAATGLSRPASFHVIKRTREVHPARVRSENDVRKNFAGASGMTWTPHACPRSSSPTKAS
jgi:hypothetical protein